MIQIFNRLFRKPENLVKKYEEMIDSNIISIVNESYKRILPNLSGKPAEWSKVIVLPHILIGLAHSLNKKKIKTLLEKTNLQDPQTLIKRIKKFRDLLKPEYLENFYVKDTIKFELDLLDRRIKTISYLFRID